MANSDCGYDASSPQDERLSRAYQSVLEDENEEENEVYNYRIKMMKNVVRSAITLSLEVISVPHLMSSAVCPGYSLSHDKRAYDRGQLTADPTTAQ